MFAAVSIVLPVFVLIGVGYLARAARIVAERTGEGLSDFVFALAVPCLLFKTIARAVIPPVQPWGYWIAYFAGLGIVWALAMWTASRCFARKGPELVVSGFAAGQSNTVFVGVPMILSAYGDEGAVPLALLLAVHLPVTITLATLLAEGKGASPRLILLKLATHPLVIAILAGSAARPFVGSVPGPLWNLIDALGMAAVPCALVALGIALRRYGLGADPLLPVLLSGLKLVVHPAIVWLLATRVFDMPSAWSGVAVLFAACPCGINAYLFAERYKQGVADASGAILISTMLGAAAMTGWLAVLGRV